MQFERETTPAHSLKIIASPGTKSLVGSGGEAERFLLSRIYIPQTRTFSDLVRFTCEPFSSHADLCGSRAYRFVLQTDLCPSRADLLRSSRRTFSTMTYADRSDSLELIKLVLVIIVLLADIFLQERTYSLLLA